jgi:outer membrane protein OmpA-like peptidoglycan-associated protein
LFNGSAAGNTASAKVSVVADPIFDKTTVIGKVFHDRDGDGWQDDARVSGLTVTADLDASAYIKGSTHIEHDGISTAVVDSKGAPITTGVKLGELTGRRSVADLPEQHRVTLRIGMYNAIAPAIRVTTKEGTQLSIDTAGRQTLEPTGDVAGGRSGQDIVVERRVVAAEQGYDLVISITNYGIEEAGIPGVRLATVGGLLIETDSRGRYHIADVDPGKLSRGRNYILKVDVATLPAASEFTTENPRVIRITSGLMNKLNFGVRLPEQALSEKIARIRLGDVFFETDSSVIKIANQPMLAKIANAIRHYRCGVISITGHTDNTGRADYNLKLGQRRADSVKRALGKLLDESLMEQVEILVAPPVDQRSSLETLSTGLGRLLAGLVDVLVPVAHADEHDDCVSMACAEDSGMVIDVVSRGELEPRSSNATTEGQADNRRVDVIFNGRLQLRDGGTVWATEDPAIIEPRLSVSGPAFMPVSEGYFTQAAMFRLYSNYSRFIERWELEIYDASDTDLITPLKTFTGKRMAYETGVEWNGETDRGHPLRAGDELVYVLRVFDAGGRFDETATTSLYVGDPIANTPAKKASLNETLNGYGESSLVRQTIPLSGSRVRIHGSDVPAAYALSIDGEPVPVDSRGTFAVERILPAGEYHMDVGITDARNESWHRQLDVKVSGGYLFMVGIADLTVGENDFSGSEKALSDEGDQDGSVSDGRLAFYMKGKFAGKYRVTAQVDTTEEDLGDVFSDLDRKDPGSVFRRLDPDRYYPTFGDESTTTSDVDTQGRFYGRVEWDKSQALWGNFNTGITGNEYIQYDRSLYGGQLEYRDVDITRFGDHETEVTVFASEPNTAFAHNEFSGTGGSLYYLRNTDIVQGSEKVWVEVRERDTNRVLENITLQNGSDYQVDDIQGRIILNRPLAQVSSSASPSIIKDQPLDGNDMFLMVDYEYLPDYLCSRRP